MDSDPGTRNTLQQGLASQRALFELTDKLYRATSLKEAYAVGLTGIVELLGCPRAAILQTDVNGIMRFVAWRGLSDQYRAAVDGHSPWTRGFIDPEPIFVADIALTDEPDQLKSVIQNEGIQSLAFIPLTLNRACVGKFMAYYDRPHRFTEAEQQTSLIIARQLSFCIERQTADFAASRLRALINSSSDAIVAKDLDGTIQQWNPGATRIFGYTPEEVIGKSIRILIPQERMAEEDEIISRIRKGELVEHYETVRRRKDGSEFHVSLTVSPIVDADGRIIGASKIARDITEQHRARERQELLLREMNHRVKNLFAVTSSIINLNARTVHTPEELALSLTDKLASLGRSQALTMAGRKENTDATLFALARVILEPYDKSGKARIITLGDDFVVPGNMITSMSLLLHELATNAAKYGSLSSDGGRIEISSSHSERAQNVTWKEVGGPKPTPAEKKGFGTRLVEATTVQLGAQMRHEWNEAGLCVMLTFPQFPSS